MAEMRHFGDEVWLYIVTGAENETPELHGIQKPAARFRMEDIQARGDIIREGAWRTQTVTSLITEEC